MKRPAIKKISHLGIVAKDASQARHFFSDILGLEAQGKEVVDEQKVAVEFFDVGASRLELLLPTTVDSPVAKFLETKGSGVQHIALEVEDIDEWLAYLNHCQVPLIDTVPRRGAHNTRIAFVHPRGTGGLLIELVQEGTAKP